MSLTLTECVDRTGVSKSTLTRSIKAGKLSAQRSEDGKTYLVDEAELARTFPLVTANHDSPAVHQNDAPGTPDSPTENPAEMAVLKMKVDMLEQQLDHERRANQKQIDDLKDQRDKWEQQAEDWKTQNNNTTLLLTHEQHQERPPENRGWLAKLIG